MRLNIAQLQIFYHPKITGYTVDTSSSNSPSDTLSYRLAHTPPYTHTTQSLIKALHLHSELLGHVCQFSGECPTSLVHHEIADTDILTHSIGPIHRLLVLPVRVDHAVAKVHEQLCVCGWVVCVCVCGCVCG